MSWTLSREKKKRFNILHLSYVWTNRFNKFIKHKEERTKYSLDSFMPGKNYLISYIKTVFGQ